LRRTDVNCRNRTRTKVASWLLPALVAGPIAAAAGSIDAQLAKLDPEERAHQACVIKGLDIIQREGKLPNADRMKTGIFGRATFTGDGVVAKGGAVRAHDHWYRLKFNCSVTADQMKATAFTYELGAEIPQAQWEDLGLW
jgi:Domain of Unknown Function (DUF930)